jgi:hypothetical protein
MAWVVLVLKMEADTADDHVAKMSASSATGQIEFALDVREKFKFKQEVWGPFNSFEEGENFALGLLEVKKNCVVNVHAVREPYIITNAHEYHLSSRNVEFSIGQ